MGLNRGWFGEDGLGGCSPRSEQHGPLRHAQRCAWSVARSAAQVGLLEPKPGRPRAKMPGKRGPNPPRGALWKGGGVASEAGYAQPSHTDSASTLALCSCRSKTRYHGPCLMPQGGWWLALPAMPIMARPSCQWRSWEGAPCSKYCAPTHPLPPATSMPLTWPR